MTPERIEAWPWPNTDKEGLWHVNPYIRGVPYILATPEALAASPEVQALIAAEREACADLARAYSAGYLDGSQKLRGCMLARALGMSLAAADVQAAIRERGNK